MMRGLRTSVLALLVLALVGGCGASAKRQGPVQTTPSPKTALAGGGPSHIAIILMENEEYTDIIGSRQTPFINALARRYALAQGMYATSHPSLPNYLALTGGSTFGITSDCTDCSVHASGLGQQLTAAHISWKAYMENLPHTCYLGGDAGAYAKRHDPFVYYTPLRRSPAQCRHVVPFSQLSADEGARALPRFIWLTPNVCHDMHDCSTATGDAFLARVVPRLLGSLGPRGLLIVTWDEGTSDNGCCRLASGGRIATILAGSAARPGARMRSPSDQYSILQTIEDLLGLPRLRHAACACTPSLAPLLRVRPARAARSASSG